MGYWEGGFSWARLQNFVRRRTHPCGISTVLCCSGLDAWHIMNYPPYFPARHVAGGSPGVGKTQLCMQLALDVQIPPELGGVAGEALYIDTEGSMMANRLDQIATSLHKHLKAVATRTQGASSPLATTIEKRCTPAVLLEHVHLLRVTELGEQISALASLPRFLERHPAVRLVVLDSVTFHFRYAESAAANRIDTRARLLQSLSQALHRAAASYNVAVVVINQMTTRFRQDMGAASSMTGDEDTGRLVPALGESWAHACTNRIILRWDAAGVRVAQLVKSPSQRSGEVRYAVTPEGVRGYKAPAAAVVSQTLEQPPIGRKRTAADAGFENDSSR